MNIDHNIKLLKSSSVTLEEFETQTKNFGYIYVFFSTKRWRFAILGVVGYLFPVKEGGLKYVIKNDWERSHGEAESMETRLTNTRRLRK